MENLSKQQAIDGQLQQLVVAMRDIIFRDALSSQQSPPTPYKKDEGRFDALDKAEFRGPISLEKIWITSQMSRPDKNNSSNT
uniref:Uncharacterized protein n=1 Tax=Globodera rostochiensis TaxID=31243 RepID=A0A914H9C6_GLORO